MPYILNKTNGAKITIVDDAAVDNTTDLSFIGRNYSGYGEIFNENFLRLLENFANDTPTLKPISGQTWYNSSSDVKKLNVYDGKQYKAVANLHVATSSPLNATTGDMWWDKINLKLKLWDGSTFREIGPQASARASFQTLEEITGIEGSTQPVIQAYFGGNPKVVISDTAFNPDLSSFLYGSNKFPTVKKGVTLIGANAVTGSSKESGYYFWGTAADSLVASTATNVSVSYTATNISFYLPFVTTATGTLQLFAHHGVSYNPSTGVLNTIASSARYADLAERYETDSVYDIGTVVVIGGPKEITVTHGHADTAVVGVISKNPAYMMNSDAGSDETHPYVALRGRVPCKVIGPVKKGNLLVTSSYPGYAEVMKSNDNPNAVFAKSLQDFSGPKGLIEVLVV